MKTVEILIALPGSGKTTYSHKKQTDHKEKIRHFDLDQFNSKTNLYRHLDNELYYRGIDTLIIDGLILNAEFQNEILTFINNYNKSKVRDVRTKVSNIKFIIWEIDREPCLHNDLFRRNENSSITIKNANVNIPNIEELKKDFDFNFSIEYKKVERKPNWQIFADKYSLSGVIESESWSNGGTWGNWKGGRGIIDADNPITTIIIIDDLLLKIDPNMSFLLYKKLEKLYEIDEYYESEYYGGGNNKAKLTCSTEKLYNFLIEYKIITADSLKN